jgi:hypothetical protein
VAATGPETEQRGPQRPGIGAERAAASAEGDGAAAGADATSAELLGQLVHQLTTLMRTEFELNQCEHAAARRERAIEIASLAGGAAAGLMAFVALTAATIRALEYVLSTWAAALVAAAAWAILAAVLLEAGKLPRLLARFDPSGDAANLERLRARRRADEEAMRDAAARFADAAARDAVGAAAARAGDAVEREGELLFRELLAVLRAPGRAGIGALGRLAGR